LAFEQTFNLGADIDRAGACLLDEGASLLVVKVQRVAQNLHHTLVKCLIHG
jgi:hypothetical protein